MQGNEETQGFEAGLRVGPGEPAPVEKARPVWSAFEEQETSLDRLVKVVGVLEDRLATAMSPRTAGSDPTTLETVAGSELEGKIRGNTHRIHGIEDRLRVLVEDLGL